MLESIFDFVNNFDSFENYDDQESLGSSPIWKDDLFTPSFMRDDSQNPFFHHNDYDGDGIENFLDNYFGPGSESPFLSTSLGAESNFTDDYEVIDFENLYDETASLIEETKLFSHNIVESGESILEKIENFITENFEQKDNWHCQEAPNSCAVAVQTDILNDFGIDVSEFDLRNMAEEMGIYTHDGGTPLSEVGELLEKHGIKLNSQRFDFSVEDLIEAKNSGEKIIIGLDAAEIWGDPGILDNKLEEITGGLIDIPSAGHAVEFKGIVEDVYGNIQVVLDDPGRPDGQNFTVPFEDFLDAWEDFGNFAVITDTK